MTNGIESEIRDADEPSLAAAEALALRRKIQFWRRFAMLVGGLACLVLLVTWQRAETSRDECADALSIYAKMATEQHLERSPYELIPAMWESLDSPVARRSPRHFELILSKWLVAPGPEPVPLAVCENYHMTFLGRGRHVLFRTAGGFQVRWVSESEALPYVREAALERAKK